MKPLLWVDTETTGLDPHRDVLIEVALIATNSPLEEQGRISRVIHVPADYPLSDFIARMHTANGLVAACRASTYTLQGVDEELSEWVRTRFYANRPIAGSNPQFDRGFLKVHLPRLAALFHYRSFDVNTLAMFFGQGKPETKTAHRAMDDIERDLALTRELAVRRATGSASLGDAMNPRPWEPGQLVDDDSSIDEFPAIDWSDLC